MITITCFMNRAARAGRHVAPHPSRETLWNRFNAVQPIPHFMSLPLLRLAKLGRSRTVPCILHDCKIVKTLSLYKTFNDNYLRIGASQNRAGRSLQNIALDGGTVPCGSSFVFLAFIETF